MSLTFLQEFHILTLRQLTENDLNGISQDVLNEFQDIFFNAFKSDQKHILMGCFTIIQNISKVFSSENNNTVKTTLVYKFISSATVISKLIETFLHDNKMLQYTSKCTLVLLITHVYKIDSIEWLRSILSTILSYLSKDQTKYPFKILELVTAVLIELKVNIVDILISDIWKSFSNLCAANRDSFFICVEFMDALLSIDSVNPCRLQLYDRIDLIIENFDEFLLQHQYRLKYFIVLKKLFSTSFINLNESDKLVRSNSATRYLACINKACSGAIKKLVCGNTDDAPFALSCNAFNKAERLMLVSSILHATLASISNNEPCLMQSSKIICILLHIDPNESTLEDEVLDLFMEQDDELIEMLLVHLLINSKLEARKEFLFHPHECFMNLLQRLSFDTSILLDWLTSNETEFLMYFIKYLKYFNSTYKLFVNKHKIDFTRFMDMLNELHIKIEKLDRRGIFPYSPKALIRIMIAAENILQQ